MDLAPTQDWTTLCALVLLLGMKHGFDADHLATIDGLTRWHGRRHPLLSRWCGTLFSVGHGLVVMAIAMSVGLASSNWQVPDWLDGFGTAVSLLCLVALGVANLHAVLAADPTAVVRPVGIKGRWLARLMPSQRQTSRMPVALQPLLIGALFALSFDTISQAALFAALSVRHGGAAHAAMLGGWFIAGMCLIDGLNGWWINHLLRRADHTARIASRVMSLAVAAISLLVAAFTVARLLLPALDDWGDRQGLLVGAAVTVLLVGSFVLARWLAGRQAAAAHAAQTTP